MGGCLCVCMCVCRCICMCVCVYLSILIGILYFLSTSVAAQTAFHSAENFSNSGASVSTSCTRNVSSDPLVGVLAFMTATFSKVSISTP